MSLEMECPHCEHDIEDDPCLADGVPDPVITNCPQCNGEIIYNLEFNPFAFNVREMPACRLELSKHEYASVGNKGYYNKKGCIHCGRHQYFEKSEEWVV